MNASTIDKSTLGFLVLALIAAACGPTTTPNSEPEPQLASDGDVPEALAGKVSEDAIRPPKPCRGGEAEGKGSIWTLEFREGDSPWYAKRWSHSWHDWAAGHQLPRGDRDRALEARIYVHDNWSISLILERDGEMLSASRLGYTDPCSYAFRDDDRNLIRFYRTRL